MSASRRPEMPVDLAISSEGLPDGGRSEMMAVHVLDESASHVVLFLVALLGVDGFVAL